MSESLDIEKLVARRNAMSEEERERRIREMLPKIEALHAVPGEPMTDDEIDDVIKRARAELSGALSRRR